MRFEEVFPALRSGLAAKSRRGINPWRLDGHGLGKSEAFIDGKWHAMPIPVWLMCLDDWEAVADPVAPKCGDPCFVAGCRETCDKPRGARTDGHGELHGHGLHAWQFDYHRARAESERCPFPAIDCDQAKVNLQSTVAAQRNALEALRGAPAGPAGDDLEYWKRRTIALREDRDKLQHLADEQWVRIESLEREREGMRQASRETGAMYERVFALVNKEQRALLREAASVLDELWRETKDTVQSSKLADQVENAIRDASHAGRERKPSPDESTDAPAPVKVQG